MRARTTAAAFGAIALLSANLVAPPAALAVAPPVIDPGALPPNDPPGPSEEMKQNKACVTPVVIADPDVGQPPPGNAMLDIRAAWQYSTGAGVSVALIDTGVTPNPRFPNLFPGGDYVMGLDNGGLTDWPDDVGIYAYGLGFHAYLAERFGADTLATLATATAASPRGAICTRRARASAGSGTRWT